MTSGTGTTQALPPDGVLRSSRAESGATGARPRTRSAWSACGRQGVLLGARAAQDREGVEQRLRRRPLWREPRLRDLGAAHTTVGAR